MRFFQKYVVGSSIHLIKSLLGRNGVFRQLKALSGQPPLPGEPRNPKKRILVYTYKWWPVHLAVESMIANALRLRDVEVTFFICDNPKEACDNFRMGQNRRLTCAQCLFSADRFLKLWGGPVLRISEFLRPEDRRTIEAAAQSDDLDVLRKFEMNGSKVGQAAEASAIRYLRLNSLSIQDERALPTMKGYLKSAVETFIACDRMLAKHKFDLVLLQCGKACSEATLIDAARKNGIPFMTYDFGIRPGTLMMKHNDAISNYDLSSLWKDVENTPLTPSQDAQLTDYLQDLQFGRNSVINQWPNPVFSDKPFDADAVHAKGGRVFLLFTNVAWDTAWQGLNSTFPTMFHWIEHTVRLFLNRPQDTLIIRVHPGEVRMARAVTRERVDEFIRSKFGELPPNIQIVAPENSLSSYSIIPVADVILIFTSTIGLEAATAGKAVVVASCAHYAKYGFTVDPATPDEYDRVLSDPKAIDPSWVSTTVRERARKYAYVFFFKYFPPFRFIGFEGSTAAPVLKLDRWTDLRPGQDDTLDAVCDALIEGRQVTFKK